MDLGAFSVSLAVRDIIASKAFYEDLGFTVVMGDAAEKWLIMRNGGHTVGLFEGTLERNSLTFNPGWDSNANELESFADVREIQRELKSRGVALLSEVNEASEGPGSLTVMDPDGNLILIDQHV